MIEEKNKFKNQSEKMKGLKDVILKFDGIIYLSACVCVYVNLIFVCSYFSFP